MKIKKDAQVVTGDSASDLGFASDLEKLDAVMRSMEWEKDDGTVERFTREVAKLKTLYKEDKYIFPLLQILSSVGVYIRSQKSRAHPDSIRLMNSVFETLARVLGGGEVADREKARLVSGEVGRLRALKKRIAHPDGPEGNITAESLDAAMAGLKKEMAELIREEFRILKRDLGLTKSCVQKKEPPLS